MSSNVSNEFWKTLESGSLADLVRILASNPELARETSPNGNLPLNLAAQIGSEEKMRALLGSGALLNALSRDELKQNCLHAAVRSDQGHLGLCRWLVSAGAELNTGDRDGRTPLHLAVARGETELVAMFVDEGADPALKDLAGASALDLARSIGRQDLISILKSALLQLSGIGI